MHKERTFKDLDFTHSKWNSNDWHNQTDNRYTFYLSLNKLGYDIYLPEHRFAYWFVVGNVEGIIAMVMMLNYESAYHYFALYKSQLIYSGVHGCEKRYDSSEVVRDKLLELEHIESCVNYYTQHPDRVRYKTIKDFERSTISPIKYKLFKHKEH